MSTKFASTSRYKRASLNLDIGNLREDQNTLYLGLYPAVGFVERQDNIIHVARRNDTLIHLATVYYRTPLLWWVIADFQPAEDDVPILSSLEPLEQGRRLVIPSLNFVENEILQQT